MGERFNFIMWLDICCVGAMLGIDPTSENAGVDTTLNIGGQVVAHHNGFLGIKAGDGRKGVLEENPAGFESTDGFGNK